MLSDRGFSLPYEKKHNLLFLSRTPKDTSVCYNASNIALIWAQTVINRGSSMENLLLSFNVVAPLLIYMIIGVVLRKTKIASESLMRNAVPAGASAVDRSTVADPSSTCTTA